MQIDVYISGFCRNISTEPEPMSIGIYMQKYKKPLLRLSNKVGIGGKMIADWRAFCIACKLLELQDMTELNNSVNITFYSDNIKLVKQVSGDIKGSNLLKHYKYYMKNYNIIKSLCNTCDIVHIDTALNTIAIQLAIEGERGIFKHELID